MAQRPQIIAHRGASKAEKENTLSDFRRAGDMGSDAVELDVRRTKDGAMAVHHDQHLADGRNIMDLDADGLPSHVPMLDEALDACEGMWVNIEIKKVYYDFYCSWARWVNSSPYTVYQYGPQNESLFCPVKTVYRTHTVNGKIQVKVNGTEFSSY